MRQYFLFILAMLLTLRSSRSFFLGSSSMRAISSSKIVTTMAQVQSMSAAQLGAILKGDATIKSNYQIIDVREEDELKTCSIKDDAIINLPLGDAGAWSPKVEAGTLLDASKPTICLCHHGMRSMRVATFLTAKAGFEQVFNVEGGIHKYAENVDPSIGFY